MDKVSVIMPCFNDGDYIQESVKSVLDQTYKNIELIIINDGSTDANTIEILNQISDTRITIINSNRLRPAGARNLGIEKSTGLYILPVDADDKIDREYIEKAVNIMKNNDKAGIVYCQAALFGERSGRWDLPDYSLEHMLVDNIVFVTALFKKADWERVGGFNTELKYGMEDYDFWLSILELDKEIVQIPEVLFHYRIKPVSRTTKFNQDSDIVKETYKIIYTRHKTLYLKHMDCYAIAMRNALVNHIFDNRVLQRSIRIIKVIDRFPQIRKLVKRMIKFLR